MGELLYKQLVQQDFQSFITMFRLFAKNCTHFQNQIWFLLAEDHQHWGEYTQSVAQYFHTGYPFHSLGHLYD